MKADYYMIKAMRFALGLSQKELAKAAGVSTLSVIRAERGDDIRATTNGAIRHALGLDGVEHAKVANYEYAVNLAAKMAKEGGKDDEAVHA